MTPASDFLEETISTLKFASRAKTITTRPRVNEIIPDQEIIRRLRMEISDLKQELVSRELLVCHSSTLYITLLSVTA